MAAGEEIASKMTVDASDLMSGADDASSAMEDVSDASDDAADSLFDVEAGGLAAGGAVAGVGTAAQEALDDSQDWRETLGRTAESTELSRDETNKLARDLSNATYPMDDAVETMDILARQGVDTAEGLEETANTADLVADATGTSAEAIAENAGPALAAFGDDIQDLEEHQDTLTHVSRNTTQSVEDFTQFIGKNREEIEDLGLSMDDTAAIMQHLEDQGYEGREAVRKFRQEASDADGDMGAFKDSVGLTEEGLNDYKGEIEESEGVTEDMAEAANESTTAMDTVNDKLDDAKLAAGEMLGPVSAIAPAMQSAGAAAMVMSTVNMSAVVPSLISVATAAAPVVIPLLAIAAAVGGLYYAWENNLFGIRDIADDVFGTLTGWADDFKDAFPGSFDEAVDRIMGVFEDWDSRPPLRDAADAMWDALPSWEDFEALGSDLITGIVNGWYGGVGTLRSGAGWLSEWVWSAVPSYDDFETTGGNLVTGIVNGWYGGVGTLRSGAGWLSEWVWSGVPSYSDFETTGGNLVTGVVNGFYAKVGTLRSGTSWVKDWVKSAVPDWKYFKQKGKNMIQGLINGIYAKAGKFKDAVQYIADIADRNTNDSDAEEGPLSNTSDWGKAFSETFAEGIDSNSALVREASQSMAGAAAPGAAGGGGAGGMGVDVHVHRDVDGPQAMQELLDAIEPHVDTRVESKLKSQNRRSDRLNRRNR